MTIPFRLAVDDPMEERLCAAALELLVERGYEGATTRAIAERAGVSEVTLFRRFPTKLALFQAAIRALSPHIAIPVPSGDLRGDLLALAIAYHEFVVSHRGFILRLMPELIRWPDLHPEPPSGLLGVMNQVFSLFRSYQERGALRRAETPEQLAVAFIGPLVARFFLTGVFSVSITLDLEAHVDGFLEGRRQ